MIRHVKKWWFLYLFFILLYLIIGAIFPFVSYKKISMDTKTKFNIDNIFKSNKSNDRAMILESNKSAWEERIRLLNQAKERIVLVTFDIREGESVRDIASILLHKANEGVNIKLLVDGFNGVLKVKGNPFFQALSSHKNIEIKLYNPINLLQPWKTQGRMHDKYVIVDNLGYILGGRNTFDYFLGDYESKSKSYDRDVLVYNSLREKDKISKSSINEVQSYFDTMWDMKECVLYHDEEKLGEKQKVMDVVSELNVRYDNLKVEQPELFRDYDYLKRTYETEGVHLITNPTHIYGKEPIVFYQLTELMKNAKERVIIHTPYAVFNEYMYQTLGAVGDIVPNYRMLINSVENGDNFFASCDYLRNKVNILNTGMTIYEYDGGTSYHGKSVVIDDDISIIGSYNFDLRSTYLDTEMMIVIKSSGFTASLVSNMEELEYNSRKVLSETEYEVPDHVVVEEISFAKNIALKVVGFIAQVFRFLL